MTDSKGLGFLPFKGLPHLLLPVVTGFDKALSLLLADTETDTAYQSVRQPGKTSESAFTENQDKEGE